MEQLRRAVARVGSQNALLAARLAAREAAPPPQAAAPAAADNASKPARELSGRAGAALPAGVSTAAGGDASAAPGSVLPSGTTTCAKDGADAPQKPQAARSTLSPEDTSDAGALARPGTVVAQKPSEGNMKPLAGPEGVAAALARRVAALAAEKRVLKALARLSLAVITDMLTGAHTIEPCAIVQEAIKL